MYSVFINLLRFWNKFMYRKVAAASNKVSTGSTCSVRKELGKAEEWLKQKTPVGMVAIRHASQGYFPCTQIQKAKGKQRLDLDVDVEGRPREGWFSNELGTGSPGNAVEGLHSRFTHSSIAAEAIRHVYQACFESPLSKEQHIRRKPPSERELRVFSRIELLLGTIHIIPRTDPKRKPPLIPDIEKVIGPREIEREPYSTRWETVFHSLVNIDPKHQR